MSEYKKTKNLEVTERMSDGENPDEVEKIMPLMISHGDDTVEGDGAIIIDWTYVKYADDLHVEGGTVEDYAIRRFNPEMKTAVIDVKGKFVRNGEPQLKLLYGKQVSKLDTYRIP